jgi:hypothetical protein
MELKTRKDRDELSRVPMVRQQGIYVKTIPHHYYIPARLYTTSYRFTEECAVGRAAI